MNYCKKSNNFKKIKELTNNFIKKTEIGINQRNAN